LVRADEVDWVEAQGNYVALHVGSEVRLLRHTLADMETRLQGHGFIRTHRRALVNRQRMQAIMPPELGELGVRLSSGQVAPLSESRRAEVVRLVLGA
ncbi:MAG: LytTR family DNA-binding domain-containing protein, partial [Variovorax sp.]